MVVLYFCRFFEFRFVVLKMEVILIIFFYRVFLDFRGENIICKVFLEDVGLFLTLSRVGRRVFVLGF